jgi:tetratricopeptide (TPR) repeat protein
MADEKLGLAEPDAEELRAAAALRDALESGSSLGHHGVALPELETAGLLRSSVAAGSRGPARRAELRQQLLASLPREKARRGSPSAQRWKLWLPLACAAAVVLAIGIRHEAEQTPVPGSVSATSPVHTSESRADPAAPADASELRARGQAANEVGARAQLPAPDLLAQAAGAYRAKLLTRLRQPELDRAHALLDRARSRVDLELAQSALTRLAAAPASAAWSADETRLVQEDVFCRLAEAALRLGQPEAALSWIRQGLELDGPPTPFLAQLSALEGQAREALGDASGAARSYMRALEINETLLDESLDGP